ncbi:esterase family protein [Alkalihalobacillus pseudalcaliphilus]|uniref:esterase family protein n=1 Tax=Alkalihalobacillus pseudalcaliphilus TaxID=79884 RepID=UPI00064D8B94|nr:esterase family protein [Alkalihalobacillus pseudalcaliphilus]KMK76015.1 hypothetical protein AB990_12330 [Alkalihalobacillus pseudalcaliphilus]
MAKQLRGNTNEAIIKSTFLDEEVKLMIYTPEDFTPIKDYDVLICQDGQDYFQLGRLPRQIDDLIEDLEIREVIIVGIPYPNVSERRNRYHPEQDKSAAYIQFLVKEVMPFLDENYPIQPFAQRRTLAGDSLAGTISLLTAVQYPKTFGQVMMHSPFVNDTVLHAIKNASDIQSLSIYHRIGLEETAVKTTDKQTLDFLEPNRSLKEILTNSVTDYDYDEFEGNHTWTYWQKDLQNGLKKLLSYD